MEKLLDAWKASAAMENSRLTTSSPYRLTRCVQASCREKEISFFPGATAATQNLIKVRDAEVIGESRARNAAAKPPRIAFVAFYMVLGTSLLNPSAVSRQLRLMTMYHDL